jgi:O-antigen/teichoic acid export membrane protein
MTPSLRSFRGLSHTTFVEGARIALAFFAVPLNTRLLGPDGFALAVAGIAAANILMPWVTLGSPHSIVRLVVRQDDDAPIGRLVRTSTLVATVLLLLAGGAAVLFPVPLIAVAVSAMAFEFLAVAPGQILAAAALGRKQHTAYALWGASPAVLRLLAAIAAFSVARAGLATAATSFAAMHLAVVLLFLPIVISQARGRASLAPGFFRGVLTVAPTQTAARAYDDFDKLLLPSLLSATAAGNYAAAYRILAYALAPVRAVLMALMPRLMECTDGPSAKAFIRRTLPAVLAASGAATVGLALVTVLGTRWILGPGFAPDPTIIALLGVSFVLRSAHFLVADALYATNRDALRLKIQVALALASITLTALLMSVYGATGAAIATLIMEVMALIVYRAVLLATPKIPAGTLQFAGRQS